MHALASLVFSPETRVFVLAPWVFALESQVFTLASRVFSPKSQVFIFFRGIYNLANFQKSPLFFFSIHVKLITIIENTMNKKRQYTLYIQH